MKRIIIFYILSIVFGINALVAQQNKIITVNGHSFEMVYVEGGTFTMGTNRGESWEGPPHQVTLSDYYIGKFEVTQAWWNAVMGDKYGIETYWENDYYPVRASYDMCYDLIRELRELTGEYFDLPTEAEWEYAAKGGKYSRGYIYSGSNNIDDVVECNGTMNAIGRNQPNELGIFDMSGNAWEWCRDYFENYNGMSLTDPSGPCCRGWCSGTRVARGGISPSERDLRYGIGKYCEVTARWEINPSAMIGFRLVIRNHSLSQCY